MKEVNEVHPPNEPITWHNSGRSVADSIYDDIPSLDHDWNFIFNRPGGRANAFVSPENDKFLKNW